MAKTTSCPRPVDRTKPTVVTRRLFAWAVLHEAKLAHEPAQVRCLVAVMVGEGSQAHWNPMDTTLAEHGATPYNSFGVGGADHVWDYPTAIDGVQATAETILGGDMAKWADVLRDPKATLLDCTSAFSRVPWAYIGDMTPYRIAKAWINGKRRYADDASVKVTGPGTWPYATMV